RPVSRHTRHARQPRDRPARSAGCNGRGSARAVGAAMSHFAATVTTTHLTPPHVLAALGGADSFDLDPCAAPLPRPWPTARRMISLPDNGLMVRWSGRVFLNPPYTGNEIGRWLARLAEHGEGVA